jgi:transposase
MMVALLLYAYAVGIYSSRRIAKACSERVDFMAIVALDGPDFRTISESRRRHLAALSTLFVQVAAAPAGDLHDRAQRQFVHRPTR